MTRKEWWAFFEEGKTGTSAKKEKAAREKEGAGENAPAIL